MSDTLADRLADRFRGAMRQLAATVTIVTTCEEGSPHGMPATAVSSLSVDPPSVLVCINRAASMHGPTTRSRHFCLNLLAADQAELCGAFGAAKGAARFDVGDWQRGEHGLPWLRGAAAVLFCSIAEELHHGTHTIFIGNIDAVEVDRDRAPLVFQDGRMGRFTV